MANRTIDEYSEFVEFTAAPGTDLAVCGLGIAGEAGECADLIKKFIYHKNPIDFDKLDKEYGDVLWYIQLYCNYRGTTIERLMHQNMTKLKLRYPKGFTEGGGVR